MSSTKNIRPKIAKLTPAPSRTLGKKIAKLSGKTLSPPLDLSGKVGGFIAELREQKGLTQSDLAKLLETTQSAIARIESGKQNLSTETLAKISQVLKRQLINLPESLNFQIEGGHPLSGAVTTNSSKNGAVFLLCASLMNQGKTILRKVPRIEEVSRILEVLTSIGVQTKWLSKHDLEIIPPKKLEMEKMNVAAALKTRSVILLMGSLVHLLPKFSIPQPGGCKLGSRTVKPHLYALQDFGVEIETVEGAYNVTSKKVKPADIVLYETGDTPTGNAIMAAAKADGASTIQFASSNYQVQELCHFLLKLGVQIEGVGTHRLTIIGKPVINETVEYTLSEDPIDSMLYLAAAAITNSSIQILRSPIDFLALELLKMEKMGFKYKILKRYKGDNGYVNLVDIETYPSKLIALEEKIHPLPYPGLNIDNLPFFVPIAAKAEGQSLIHDWVYENRAIYYTELSKLGANVNLMDPHRVQITGPVEFRATEIVCPPALRPAAIILISMLAAKGTSILRNVYSINRGYEDIHEKLNSIGAKIKTF